MTQRQYLLFRIFAGERGQSCPMEDLPVLDRAGARFDGAPRSGDAQDAPDKRKVSGLYTSDLSR
eukprot:4780537-Alexandrium_andersonii.AAC.1